MHIMNATSFNKSRLRS